MKKEEFKKYNLPETSGVYFFLDKKHSGKNLPYKKNVLYVGKATVLKDRVSSYFNDAQVLKSRGVRILSMVENAKDIFFIETKSVLEAIILETKYIKELKPFFNVKDLDDKSYSYVVITNEEFPRVLIVRGRELEKDFENVNDLKIDKKYGPFVSKLELVEIMKFVRKIFPYRDKCKIGEKRGCFNYQIGLCPGVCVGAISKKDYNKNIKSIEKILDGKIGNLLKDLEKEMKSLAKEKRFEEAAKVRNKINAFNYIKDINLIKKENSTIGKISDLRIESYDISHISGKNRVGVMVVVEDGEFKKGDYRRFKITEEKNDDIHGLLEVLKRRFAHSEWKYPDILVVDGGRTHLNFIHENLAGILDKKVLEKILFASVVKNDKHKAREILYIGNVDKQKKEKYNELIILANEETHRFAISYHRLLRNKIKRK